LVRFPRLAGAGATRPWHPSGPPRRTSRQGRPRVWGPVPIPSRRTPPSCTRSRTTPRRSRRWRRCSRTTRFAPRRPAPSSPPTRR
jgi:hypothetical protein